MNPTLLIDQLKGTKFFQFFTIYTRYLIGSAFVIAAFGMGKVVEAFPIAYEQNAPAHSISRLFETFTNSGLYWQFIGWTQILAGFLLMTQKFARLGAVVFFPLILNIFVITVSYDFHGTPFITGLMLLANLYLLVWDYEVLQYLVVNPNPETMRRKELNIADDKLWAITGLLLFVTIVVLSLLKINPMGLMLTCLLEGVLVFIYFFFRGMRVVRA